MLGDGTVGKKFRILSVALCLIMASSLCVHAEPVGAPVSPSETVSESEETGTKETADPVETETQSAKTQTETQSVETQSETQSVEAQTETQPPETNTVSGQAETEPEDQQEGETVSEPAIAVESLDYSAGTAKVVITGVPDSKDISGVTVPVWSKDKQADIRWYDAVKGDDGVYRVTINIANHGYNSGVYNVHSYIKDSKGEPADFIGQTTADFSAKKGTASVEKTSAGYRVTVTGAQVAGGFTKITVPVWSEENGQDDIKWINGSYDSSTGTAYTEYKASEFKSFGKYFAHVYATNRAGTLVCIGTTEYTVNKPTAESVEVTTDNASGKFKVVISGVSSDTGISKIQVPTWSEANGQDDIRWYDAKKQSDGTYVVEGNISNHGYGMGTYNFHAYVVDSNGAMGFVGKKTADFKAVNSGVTVDTVKANSKYTASVSDIQIAGGVKSVVFPVWSEANGQDDIVWYEAKKSGNTYSVTFDISKHKTAGKYNVHAYARNSAGALVFLGKYENLTVDDSVSASVSVENANSTTGSFDVYVKINSAAAGISKVQIPVWSEKNGQDDIIWYNAAKQSDGRYKCSVTLPEHKNNVGTYNVHAYVTYENGIMKFACKTTHAANPSNYLYVEKPATAKRDIYIYNVPSDSSTINIAVWSEKNGQDDIKWYQASRQSDGGYKASISLSGFKNSGTFNAHVYKDWGKSTSKFLSKTTFSVSSNEIAKNGWIYEGGYKFYYENGKKLTDVRSKLGAQSTYRIEVNRQCNTVTIYAKDGSNGYIIPVVAFACSVGLPQTPTYTGNYTVGAKYRWKALIGPSWGQYATTVSGQAGVYFHSVAGSATNSYSLPASEYNKLGSAASHGCIRLNVRDAKWIYDNVPQGSQIRIYDSSTSGPLGKPATIKIPLNQNWDPTDPNV